MNPNDNLWQTILKDLERLYNEETYNELFSPVTSTFKEQNGLITMVVENDFLKNRINKLYIGKINELATKYSKTPVRFKFISQSEVEPEPTLTDRKLTIDYRQGNLNSTYTFDSFVVGKSNMFAFRMAMKVADQPGAVANPFYIFGDVGLGKTHLMQAIGNYILDTNVEKRILYVKADNFIEDFVSLLSRNNNKTEEFNAKYKDIDVILVDDIQIMANATKTQMEFFKLFDYLYLNSKQIVITSDKPASQLTNIMPRLTTRFEAGLSVDIQVPDLEHRVNILKRKIATIDANAEVSDSILEFIATQFAANIREMEGALIRLISYAQTFNLDITMELVNDALGALLKTRKKSDALSDNNYDKIQSVVSDYFQISLQDLIGKKRHTKFTIPRHIAMYLIKLKYNIPYKTIGQLFSDRDHSTVLAACERIEKDIQLDSNLKFALDSIIKKIDSTLSKS
ncbi:Chromosomal replication initiator protein DnaA [Acholeplasma oculi]|uniref:Chromosomal replication initiator protein DnaA n=1 Tax=Acholeplasma oculi TaxID=35623 RepID=A0A061A9J8_9MOLU|nr:chromosomal replication initiator protein DnaA [Acholeplasma oculi]CDR30074.1 Chromosomal replication initiator protein DnaA [Acholeplasma oculi]SKC49948.1 chromosomal replication initiator protein DnaA [Acholeplasma oculi]SUT88194.1 Chromosomal replication initiator protein DnaA [Acholeplasma oculi]